LKLPDDLLLLLLSFSYSQVDDVGVVGDLELDGVHWHPEGLALGVLADLLDYLDDLVLTLSSGFEDDVGCSC
jgi:hypothetical protein